MRHTDLAVNGINLRVHLAGPDRGRPVWLLHGFPECWYSWRHQSRALTDAGYQVLIPELRGYGASSAPDDVAAYDLVTLCGDIREAMDALDQPEASVVGHDWGAPVAWNLALLEPERIRAVAGMSVPFGGRPKQPAITYIRRAFEGRFHYIMRFQQPGVAERELESDIRHSLLMMFHNLSAAVPKDLFLQEKPEDAALFDGLEVPAELPVWLSEEGLDEYVRSFEPHGFRGALNWYRNFERSWERTASLAGRRVEQPALFLLGDKDPVGTLERVGLQNMPTVVPRVEQHVLSDCGHWIQNERPEEVNRLLVEFLGRCYPT